MVFFKTKTLLAKIAFDNKNYEGSEKIVKEILEANSSYDDAKVLQARLLLVKEQYDEAIALLNQVIWSKEDSEEDAVAILLAGFITACNSAINVLWIWCIIYG